MSRPGSRAERLEEARRLERRASLRTAAKWGGIGLAAILVVAGAGYGLSLVPDPPRNVHWHPTWEAYVYGENVRWASPRFDMREMGMATHFHQPDDTVIHAEGRTDRLYLSRLFIAVGGEISDDRLVIPAGTNVPGTYVANETDRLRVFIQPYGEDWRELDGGFADLHFEDKMRILVTFGHPTDEEIARQQESVKGAPEDAASAMTPTQATPDP